MVRSYDQGKHEWLREAHQSVLLLVMISTYDNVSCFIRSLDRSLSIFATHVVIKPDDGFLFVTHIQGHS